MVLRGVTVDNKEKMDVFNHISFFTWFCEPTLMIELVGDEQFAEIIKIVI